MHNAVAQLQPPPESVADYIEDMLGELAKLAASVGDHALATTITIAAIQASRSASDVSN